MVNFPALIPDCDFHSPTLFDWFIPSGSSICSTVASRPLGNSDHIVVTAFIEFASDSKGDATFHRTAYDYTGADWDDLRDHLRYVQSVYPKCHFVFLINWNTKLEIKFWFLFLYWNWDIKHKTNWFFDFQNNRTLKFKLEVRFSFFILIWKTKNQIYLNKYLIKLVTRSHNAIAINT